MVKRLIEPQNHTQQIPAELRELPIWLLWKRVEVKENGETKFKKKPYSAANGRAASSTDPATWTSYNAAMEAYSGGGYDGLGIGIAGDIGAVDIDHCVKDGALSDMAQDIVAVMDTYTEYSPSGTGLRLIFSAPGFKYDKKRHYINNQDAGLEVYIADCTSKFVTITGNVFKDRPIAERSDEILAVLDAYMVRPQAQERSTTRRPHSDSMLTDEEVVQKAGGAVNGEKFIALWGGEYAGFSSHSEADMSLCNILAFYCGGDLEQMDRLFRQSGLIREKWDELHGAQTYGEMTLEKAVNDCVQFYGESETLDVVRPYDFTDAGNAQVFARVFAGRAVYVKTVGWLIWDGKRWADNDLDARELAIGLTDMMLYDATADMKAAGDALTAAEVGEDSAAEGEAKMKKKLAEAYRKHAKASRAVSRIDGMLKLAQALMQLHPEKLDANPYLLNTPEGIIDLRAGSIGPHNPVEYCTKTTLCGPSAEGMSIWLEFINTVTCGNVELAEFLQYIAGMAAIGRVFEENLITALGDGRNGKSAFFNTLAAVMGDYRGTLAAEVLTTSNRSKGAELATLRGKRFVIAAETEEGARLAPSMVKQLTSTDRVHAERKYKDPEDFTPSHTVILYTNHLPRVGSMDSGIWRRLVVVPFDAKIAPTQEVKNYSEVLVREAGGAILSWIVEGAARFIAAEHKLPRPAVVQATIDRYKQDNDWMTAFLEDKCEFGPGKQVGGAELYTAYRYWADETGEYKRHIRDFNAELDKRGIVWRKTKRGAFWFGLNLDNRVNIPTVFYTSSGGEVTQVDD